MGGIFGCRTTNALIQTVAAIDAAIETDLAAARFQSIVRWLRKFDMDIQRLRNLTTHRLHTKMEHIYQDLGFIIGDDGIMTHMIPRVLQAIEPWLREQITDARFWNGEYDPTHTGDHLLRAMTPEENKAALERYAAMPNPLAGKEVIPVVV